MNVYLVFLLAGSCLALNELCTKNKDCKEAHSFCGWHESNDFDHTLCMCPDEYTVVNGTCKVRFACLNTGFNGNQLAGFGCPYDRQFCRRSVCVCQGPYVYDENNFCILRN